MTELSQRAIVAVALLLAVACVQYQLISTTIAMLPVWGAVLYDVQYLVRHTSTYMIAPAIIYEVAITMLLHRMAEGMRTEIIKVVILISVSDIAQYLAGRYLSNHKIGFGPSPHKSWEGYLGAASVIPVGWLLGMSVLHSSVFIVLGVVGDLTESKCKRIAGLKDISDLLGHHGGWLDRVDGVYMGVVGLALLYQWN
jgi:CDP-diglyceride synthetase